MCHQTVGLVQGELEGRGIVTASITLLPEITSRVRPPRALSVPYPLGFPLGTAHAADLQRQVLRELLGLVHAETTPIVAELGFREPHGHA